MRLEKPQLDINVVVLSSFGLFLAVVVVRLVNKKVEMYIYILFSIQSVS